MKTETDRIAYLRRVTGHDPVRDVDGLVTCADCGERHASAAVFPVVACPGPPRFSSDQAACPEVLADRDGNCTACGKPILSPAEETP